MSRLFTFGCSFTNYRWSTWADCLAPEFDYFQNWGQSGAGNQFIFNSVMECDQRYNFGPNDTVIVCWTDVMREDWYTVRWQTHGNMVNNKIYNKDFEKTHSTSILKLQNAFKKFSAQRLVKTLLKEKRANQAAMKYFRQDEAK
jgi:hypothetical protein